ncbi:LysR family transcriptional regulator [Solirubrobacter soli]|uniref:LysR family transcriptional regulator n=1 Tax=Solirubrobacter soli TaxID=363832 RepID=UPI00040566B9|nr:LysR family transcriptional regulator [Solirubrobacter soli]
MAELRHLRYFVAVAEELSFSRAADRLHMAASPLSQAIRQLEAELGVELFVRTTRTVTLTAAGERLLAEGVAALQAVDAAFANAARAGRGVLGTLRLGSSPAARHEIRPALLGRLREAHPGIAVDASEATTGNLCRELLSHRIDVALGFCTEPVPGLARRVLSRERMHVYMRRTHPLAGAEELSVEVLRGARVVIPADDLNSGFNRRLRMRGAFEPVVVSAIWEDAEWPPGDDLLTLATGAVARRAPAHMAVARLVPEVVMPVDVIWREDDDSPVLARFLEVATPAPEPAGA